MGCLAYLPVGIVESHGVDDVGVLVEGTQLLARVRVPHFAGAIVTSRNEFASIFVEGTVSQGEKMGSEDLEEAEALHLVL